MLLFAHMLTKHNSCRKHFFAVETLKTRQIWVVRCVYEVLRGQRFVYSREDLLGKLGFQHIKELVDMDEIIW
jgi:hypothetical protein